jgi:aspartate 1-decarboxylase
MSILGTDCEKGNIVMETFLKSKIHRAVVTQSELDYAGSIAIGRNLMEASGLRPYERVLVANFTNGARWWTYAIPAEDGVIGLNGGSARRGVVGDVVAILSFVHLGPDEEPHPRVVLVREGNQVKDVLTG